MQDVQIIYTHTDEKERKIYSKKARNAGCRNTGVSFKARNFRVSVKLILERISMRLHRIIRVIKDLGQVRKKNDENKTKRRRKKGKRNSPDIRNKR